MGRILMLILSCTFVFGGFATVPEVQAADPVSWAVLAPFAIRVADRMSPYAEKGFVTGLRAMVRIVFDIVDVLKLYVRTAHSKATAHTATRAAEAAALNLGGVICPLIGKPVKGL